MRLGFLLRWSARDLRRRWAQVAAIALIIAIGTGVYSALGSTASWRRQSNDASFDLLAMYDLRVVVSPGSDAPVGEMARALRRLPDPTIVEASEERLVMATQVDASTGDDTILVPGRVVGVDVEAGAPSVNTVWVAGGDGRTLRADDAGAPTVVLEKKFTEFYGLAPTGRLTLGGGNEVDYVGAGLSPEYFIVLTDEGGFFAEANFAVVFTSLETAQAVTGRTGRVNDLVLRLRPGVDPATAARQVEDAFGGSGLGVTVMERADEDAYRVLYDDIESDQQFWNVFAALILAGAGFGAFNLATRMVEAARREIGVGMALGVSRGRLALRPLLVGAEIAVLGVVFGVGVGLGVTAALRPVYETFLPLPVWITELQAAKFAEGAAIGFVLPLVATAWPVWRAVRVMPVDAITTTHRSARGGLSPLLRRLRWPARAFSRMPLGNVLRTPRRTLLTALGIGAAVTAAVATLGMVDSLLDMVGRSERELLRGDDERVTVALDGLYDEGSAEISAIAAADGVAAVQPVLRVPGTVRTATSDPVEVLLDAVDLGGEIWTPTLSAVGPTAPERGIVLSEKAAGDLGVRPGDQVVLQHPVRSEAGFEVTETAITVTALHPAPFRFSAFVDRSVLAGFGAAGATNQLYAVPTPGTTARDLQRALFDAPAVASVQPAAAMSTVVRDRMDEFVAIFQVLVLFVLLLALLIAYNATSISTDERAREHATLFAFGLPVRRVVRMDVVESLLIGAFGTVAGVAGGVAVLSWMTSSLMSRTMPEVGIEPAVSAATLATAVGLGVVAVAAAPLLTLRRLRHMDIPSTLRVVE